tara:strand:+ start:1426 stop:1554 length:129 start_codon:yes stop_codon:yes gene_type:complete
MREPIGSKVMAGCAYTIVAGVVILVSIIFIGTANDIWGWFLG